MRYPERNMRLSAYPRAYAHRGFSLDGLENSMRAFQAAVDLGYRCLETDARASADGVAFAFHDYLLDRVTNSSGRVRDLTARQIEQARIMGSEPIPRLADLLTTFDDAWFNIDVKSADAIGPVLDVIRTADAWHRVRLASFSSRRLAALREAAGPSVATALSPREVLALKAASRQQSTRVPTRLRRLANTTDIADFSSRSSPGESTSPAAHAQVPHRLGWIDVVDRRFVQLAHQLGIGVDVWTVNQRATMIQLLDLGVDGIMTDRADVLRDVLQERAQWAS